LKVANQIHFLRILCGGYHEMEFLNFFYFLKKLGSKFRIMF